MAKKNKRPNIVFIMSDQHRYDCLGCYGNREIQTPRLDQLAEDGVVYDNSFCASPVCVPSRHSILTGLYPHQHHNKIPTGLPTWPKILRQHGYRTKLVGKMHLTPMYANVGFEQMELAEHGSKRYEDDYHRYLKAHDLVDKYDFFDNYKEFRHQAPLQYEKSFGAAESMLPEKHYSTTWIGEKALSSIRHWKDEENFLMVSFLKPHHPFDPPAPWSRMYDPDQLSVLPGWTEHCLPHDQDMHKGHRPHTDLTQNIIKRVMAYYYGAISQIDDYVGKITDLLKAKGIYDNTLIVYTSDHGEYLGFHHMLGKLNYMYDPLEKVPLIIKYPDQYGKGTRSDALINNIDLAPTLLKQASCPPGEFMPGIDFSRGQSKNKYVFAENGIGQRFMVRSKTHKLLLCKQESKSLFFDLAEDPFELNNLYPRPEYKTMIDEYKQALSSMMLLGASSTAHSDESVPTIEGENVPPENENWRQELAAWITQKMQS